MAFQFRDSPEKSEYRKVIRKEFKKNPNRKKPIRDNEFKKN